MRFGGPLQIENEELPSAYTGGGQTCFSDQKPTPVTFPVHPLPLSPLAQCTPRLDLLDEADDLHPLHHLPEDDVVPGQLGPRGGRDRGGRHSEGTGSSPGCCGHTFRLAVTALYACTFICMCTKLYIISSYTVFFYMYIHVNYPYTYIMYNIYIHICNIYIYEIDIWFF